MNLDKIKKLATELLECVESYEMAESGKGVSEDTSPEDPGEETSSSSDSKAGSDVAVKSLKMKLGKYKA